MDLRWLAGFVDGEGCVRLAKERNGGWSPSLFVTQKDLGVLRQIRQDFGGRLYSIGKTPPAFQLRWGFNRAVELAERLLPYSITKHDQLAVLIEANKVAPKDRGSLAKLITEMKHMEDTVLLPSDREAA